MKTTLEVPLASNPAKGIKLTLDHDSGKVSVVNPATFRTPEVELADLARALDQLLRAHDTTAAPQ